MGFPEHTPITQKGLAAFREGLKSNGWEEGRNVQIEYRWPNVDPALARTFAKELIALKPDVIVASSNQVVSIAMQETQSIPIVFVFVGDPIGSHYAETLARPGKNLTGFAAFEAPIGGKWLELLKEISPHTKRVGFVYHPAASPHLEFLQFARAAAPSLGLELAALSVTSPAEIEQRVSAFAAAGNDGAIVVAPHTVTFGSHELINKLAAQYRLPCVYGDRVFAYSGGLLTFGINLPDQLRRVAGYVDRILKGEKASELPVQLPVKYELIINLQTAKTLGLTVPPTLLARADEVIE